MDKKAFSKFVAREEERQREICSNPEYFCSELEEKHYRECVDITIEILTRLASSDKAKKFISKVKHKSFYGETGVRIGDDLDWDQIEIFFVTGDELEDVITVESNIYEKSRYYQVTGPESFYDCDDIDSLIDYLENIPRNGVVLVSKTKNIDNEREKKTRQAPVKLKKILKQVNKELQNSPRSLCVDIDISECRKKGFSFTRSFSFLREYLTAFIPVNYSFSLSCEEDEEYTYLRIFSGPRRCEYIEIYSRTKSDEEISTQYWGIFNNLSGDKKEFENIDELKKYVEEWYLLYRLSKEEDWLVY